jgi:hypothetical protein
MKTSNIFFYSVFFVILFYATVCFPQIQVNKVINDTIFSTKISCNRVMFGVKSSKLNCIDESYKYGYLDSLGRVIIEPVYDRAQDFVDGLAVVKQCGESGGYHSWHILPDGKKLYQQKYVDVRDFINGYAIVDKDGGYHMCHISKTGKPAYSQTYQWLYDFNEAGKTVGIRNINLSTDKCVWVVLDTKGKEIYFYSGGYSTVLAERSFPEKLEQYLK